MAFTKIKKMFLTIISNEHRNKLKAANDFLKICNHDLRVLNLHDVGFSKALMALCHEYSRKLLVKRCSHRRPQKR